MSRPANRFFVTGLCLQGNKGGPALALSLMDAIRREIPAAEFVFSVPDAEEEWPHEQRWANQYGVSICKNATLSCLVPPFCFRRGRLRRFLAWWKALRSCEAMIQMSAICYIGPPAGAGTLVSVLRSPRWSHFVLAWAARRPMRAWTQTYGPLSTRAVRFFAQRDLRRQPVVFCRGADCAAAVQHLLPTLQVMDFPDVATTLTFDRTWGRRYVEAKFPRFESFVTLSPSAVLYARSDQISPNGHVNQCVDICTALRRSGHKVILVPHTLRPSRHDPTVCDLAVAERVHQAAANDDVALLTEDLSPVQLKSVIANATFHVGARYHSVVAALSAGVPAISLSWHAKYRDLMRAYGMSDYVVEENEPRSFDARQQELAARHTRLRAQLASAQADVVGRVRENARLFCRLLQRTDGER